MDIDVLATSFVNDYLSYSHKVRGVVSFAVKKNYPSITSLNEDSGFFFSDIINAINEKMPNGTEIEPKAFYSAMRRQRSKKIHKPVMDAAKVRAHEKSNVKPYAKKAQERQSATNYDNENLLSDDWLKLLEKHAVMPVETIQKAIDNGLTYEIAKEADRESIIKFAEVVNKYFSRQMR